MGTSLLKGRVKLASGGLQKKALWEVKTAMILTSPVASAVKCKSLIHHQMNYLTLRGCLAGKFL